MTKLSNSKNAKNINSMLETHYLVQNRIEKVIQTREKDNSNFTDINALDWDKL